VDVLPDGRGALERARETSFDLVICDVRMPGMDGQEFFAALQRMESPLCKHILFVTGDGVAARTQEFLAQHRLPHVAKPFRVEELSVAVRSLLEKTLQPVGRVSMLESLGTGSGNDGTANSSE
jgi:CheY-like chemotaxis protein